VSLVGLCSGSPAVPPVNPSSQGEHTLSPRKGGSCGPVRFAALGEQYTRVSEFKRLFGLGPARIRLKHPSLSQMTIFLVNSLTERGSIPTEMRMASVFLHLDIEFTNLPKCEGLPVRALYIRWPLLKTKIIDELGKT